MEFRTASPHQLRKTLQADHQHLWDLFSAMRHAEEDQREIAFTILRRALAVHEAAEGVIMHNTLVDDLTRERLDEEREAAEIVDRLEAHGVASPGFDDVFDQLERTVRAHAEAEEDEEVAHLAKHVGEAGLGEILRGLRQVREMGEDAASPVTGATYRELLSSATREFEAFRGQLR